MRKLRKRSTGHMKSTSILTIVIIGCIMMFNHYKEQDIMIVQLSADIISMQQEIEVLKDDIKTKEEDIARMKDSIAIPQVSEKTETSAKTTYIDTSNVNTIKNRDLREFEPISVEQMNLIIDNLTKNNTSSPFRGQGEVFIKASQVSGLDPRYILAHAAIESGWGTSRLARNKHNYFGIAAYDSSPGSAYAMGNSLESGIINGAKWIADNYTNKGQSTLHLMIYGKKRYASDGKWILKISNIMSKCSTV